MNIVEYINHYSNYFDTFMSNFQLKAVPEIISKKNISEQDLLHLLQPLPIDQLELMAQKSHAMTKQNFGQVINLYAPLYLSNYCINYCKYCGFHVHNKINRKQLNEDEIHAELKSLYQKGFRHIVLLTGESPSKATINYLQKAANIALEYMSQVSIEVYPLALEEYQSLNKLGVTGLTLYQEIYDQKCYSKYHVSGPKKNYIYRITAADRAAQSNFKQINIGVLLGLNDPIKEVFLTAMHLKYLEQTYPWLELTISFPRITMANSDFTPPFQVSDRQLVQFITAIRLFSPRTGINLSTRESRLLRDNLIPLGITRMSAESKTTVGGYASPEHSGNEQFQIHDDRPLIDIIKEIKKKGYQPILKDWEKL